MKAIHIYNPFVVKLAQQEQEEAAKAAKYQKIQEEDALALVKINAYLKESGIRFGSFRVQFEAPHIFSPSISERKTMNASHTFYFTVRDYEPRLERQYFVDDSDCDCYPLEKHEPNLHATLHKLRWTEILKAIEQGGVDRVKKEG